MKFLTVYGLVTIVVYSTIVPSTFCQHLHDDDGSAAANYRFTIDRPPSDGHAGFPSSKIERSQQKQLRRRHSVSTSETSNRNLGSTKSGKSSTPSSAAESESSTTTKEAYYSTKASKSSKSDTTSDKQVTEEVVDVASTTSPTSPVTSKKSSEIIQEREGESSASIATSSPEESSTTTSTNEETVPTAPPTKLPTGSPTSAPTTGPTSAPTTSNLTVAPVVIKGTESSAPTNFPTSSPINLVPRKVIQMIHLEDPNACIAYDPSLSTSAMRMIECSTTTVGNELDYWELIMVDNNMFLLRHKSSGLCIPKNPEHPDQPFDCFRYSGNSVAIADSFNGLVDCSTDFVATMGWHSTTGSLYLYNTDCMSTSTAEAEQSGDRSSNSSTAANDVIFMSYQKKHGGGGDNNNETPPQVAMWGEQILMTMPHLVQQHNFQALWIMVEV